MKMGEGTSGWFVVCMGDGVGNRFLMVHDKTNGRWELRCLMIHDELRNMGHLMPMKNEAY